MDQANENDKRCYNMECDYSMKPHYHVMTNNGSYVRFIVDKPKYSKEINNADTR